MMLVVRPRLFIFPLKSYALIGKIVVHSFYVAINRIELGFESFWYSSLIDSQLAEYHPGAMRINCLQIKFANLL
jgi:hypothetical protein